MIIPSKSRPFIFLLLAVAGLGLIACQSKRPITPMTTNPLRQASPSLSPRAASASRDVFAWCIVPFDTPSRTPQQRIDMLIALGIDRYAYDWRQEHLATMAEEWRLARANEIEIIAVWLWIDADWDQPDALSENNERVFAALEEVGLHTQLWLGFHANYFEGKTDAQAIEAGRAMIGALAERAEALGCRVALYNHGDWFGEPDHQIEIVEALPKHDIGLIYNFHHGHEHIEGFASLAQRMAPYLWAVNLNGMRPEGPKILPLGTGTAEADMLAALLDAGYDGPLGILGHVDDVDVMPILRANLHGLQRVLSTQ